MKRNDLLGSIIETVEGTRKEGNRERGRSKSSREMTKQLQGDTSGVPSQDSGTNIQGRD
jgi:hypothetical protein